MNLISWLSKIYSEEDFGRSIATTMSGIVGLIVYFLSKDWVISIFSWVIVFPLFRIIASAFHTKWKDAHKAQKLLQNLSAEEQTVMRAFIESGGAVLSFRQLNRAELPSAGVESLLERGVLRHTVLGDLMTEAMAMDTEWFDIGQRAFPRPQTSSSNISNSDSEEIPF